MANANQSWKYFDTKAKSWKKLPKDSYQKFAKKGNPIGIFWLSKGKETGSYKVVVNQKASRREWQTSSLTRRLSRKLLSLSREREGSPSGLPFFFKPKAEPS